MAQSDFRAAVDDQLIEATDGWSKTYTLSGVSVVQSSNWSAKIRRTPQDSAALVTCTIAVDTGDNTVTVSLTDTQVAALMTSGDPRFVGCWSLRHDATDRTYVKGAFVAGQVANR